MHHKLMDRIRQWDIPKLSLAAILTLYESISRRVHTVEGLSDIIHSIIRVKQGCPLSLTLFGLYIDELESLILETIGINIICLLHGMHVLILLFVDDIVLLSHIA